MHRAPLCMAAAALAFLAGCGSSGSEEAAPPPHVMAKCAAQVDYAGESFVGSAVRIEPVPGRTLGEGTIPPCGDIAGEEPAPEQPVALAAVDGVSADVAVLRAGETGTVYIRRGLAEADWPPALRKLLNAPACASGDDPIELTGTWRGTTGSEPPYDVELYVRKTSDPRYERAYLNIRVPRTLAPAAVDESAFESYATIRVAAHCDGATFVADGVGEPPS